MQIQHYYTNCTYDKTLKWNNNHSSIIQRGKNDSNVAAVSIVFIEMNYELKTYNLRMTHIIML